MYVRVRFPNGVLLKFMIDVCFWCCKPKENDSEGKPTFNDYEPCSDCGTWWNKGILVIEISTEPNGNPPIVDRLFPTGLWAIVSEDNIKKVLTQDSNLDIILKSRTMYLNSDDWKKMISDY